MPIAWIGFHYDVVYRFRPISKIDHLVAPKFLVEVRVNRVYIGYLEKMKTNLRTDHMQAPLELKKDFQWGIKR